MHIIHCILLSGLIFRLLLLLFAYMKYTRIYYYTPLDDRDLRKFCNETLLLLLITRLGSSGSKKYNRKRSTARKAKKYNNLIKYCY